LISCFLSTHPSLAALDGNQLLDFYWIDPIEATVLFITKRQYSGNLKLYTQFAPGTATSYMYQGHRAFDTCANSGMVFEAAQLIDLESSPVLALFFSDASFSGQHMTHHPIYCKLELFVLF
jgi:3'-phosphoadenosine 5'-phosphosulfate (PAPS) 3'-phosphatase